jgi:hypothetical protein
MLRDVSVRLRSQADLKAAHAQELKTLREVATSSGGNGVIDCENVPPHVDAPQRKSGKKTSGGVSRKKSGSKRASHEEVPLSIVDLDPVDHHDDVSETTGVVAQAIAAIESKASKRQRGIKRRWVKCELDSVGLAIS